MKRFIVEIRLDLDILPYIKENFNEDIVETLNRMACIASKR